MDFAISQGLSEKGMKVARWTCFLLDFSLGSGVWFLTCKIILLSFKVLERNSRVMKLCSCFCIVLFVPSLFSRVYDNKVQLSLQLSTPMLSFRVSSPCVYICDCDIKMKSKVRDTTLLLECLLTYYS